MNTRHWRRRCAGIVNALDIPDPFDIDELCRRVSEARGRKLTLHAVEMPGPLSGMWLRVKNNVTNEELDCILYERGTSRLHQEHIKAHELGHNLGGHTTVEIHTSDSWLPDLPDLDPDVVQRVTKRTNYTAAQEREAEMIASLILQRANRWRPESEWPANPATAGIRKRLGDALEPPQT